MQWVVATAAFLASAVEFVEAFTIVLVVGVTVNWRSALLGALAAAATLALLVATLGTALVQWVPLDVLRTVIGLTKLIVSFLLRPFTNRAQIVACCRGIWHGVSGNIAARY